MATFALACEGVTDQIALENILCGFYKEYDNLDEEIQPLQPPFDVTTHKQKEGEFGGWEMLLEYLSTKRFRDDVLNSTFLIVQIDTDISEHPHFGVFQHNLTPIELVERVQTRLIEAIDTQGAFYQNHRARILFAVAVHSLECWIVPLYESRKHEKTNECFSTLQRAARIPLSKNYQTYDRLTRPFLKRKTLMATVAQNSSFGIFIDHLPDDVY